MFFRQLGAVVLLAFLISGSTCAHLNPTYLNQLIENGEGAVAKKMLLDFFSEVPSLKSSSPDDQRELAEALYLYGRLIYFKEDPDQPNKLKLAYYYFKLAAHYGSPEALYMLSVFSFYQLDGSGSMIVNLEDPAVYESLPYLTKEQEIVLLAYLHSRRISNSQIYAYYASLQNITDAMMTLAFRHKILYESTMDMKECQAMSLYYEHICSMIYQNVTNPPNILNNKRIDLAITQKDAEEVQVLDKSQIQMSHKLDAIETEEQMKLINLIAMSYFYGINGVKQNFQESYRLFNKIHSYKKNNEILSRLAFMNLKGLGTPQNFKLAYEYYLEASLKDTPEAFAGLGHIYYYGLGRPKNISKAFQYYKIGSQYAHAESQYMYGLLHMLPSSYEVERDENLGLQYMLLAAQQNVQRANYAIGLYFLDGGQYSQTYSCGLSANFLFNAAQFGPWSRYQQQGWYYYLHSDYKKALPRYLLSASMGNDESIINSAIIADKHQPIEQEDIEYSSLELDLVDDPVYELVVVKKEYKPYASIWKFLYEDVYSALEELEDSHVEVILQRLLEPPATHTRNINYYIAQKLLFYAESTAAYSSMRLGDFYSQGIYVRQDYEAAFMHYSECVEESSQKPRDYATNNYIRSRCFEALSHLAKNGLGTAKNLTQAKLYLSKIQAGSEAEGGLDFMKQSFFDKMTNAISRSLVYIASPEQLQQLISELRLSDISDFAINLALQEKQILVVSCIVLILMCVIRKMDEKQDPEGQ